MLSRALSCMLLQEFQIPVSVSGPPEIADAIQKQCAVSKSFTLRVDGFVGMFSRCVNSWTHARFDPAWYVTGVNFMFYDDFWRTAYQREVPCPT